MRDFELQIYDDSEDHQFALDLIENLIEVGEKDGLHDSILLEVMMVYSVKFNLLYGNKKLMHELLADAFETLEKESGVGGDPDALVH